MASLPLRAGASTTVTSGQNWVVRGRRGTLYSFDKHLEIKHHLRDAARRLQKSNHGHYLKMSPGFWEEE